MFRHRIVALAFAALGLVTSVSAFASPDGNGGKPKFPMPAAEFSQKVTTRLTKARTHMEQRASKLPADKAKELRAKFDARAAKVNEALKQATADGTVTKDEAKAVRAEAKAMRPGGRHAHHGKGRHGKGGHPKGNAPKDGGK